MAIFDDTVTIKGWIQSIWREIVSFTNQEGMITAQKAPNLLVIRRADKCYIYYLQSQVADVVRLRHIVTTDVKVGESLQQAQDLTQALENLPGGPSPEVVRAAQARLRAIVERAERTPEPQPAPLYRQGHILLTMLLNSLFFGGLMLADNWARLGRRNLSRLTLLITFVGVPILAVLAFAYALLLTASEELASLVGLGVFVLSALVLLRWQRPAYKAGLLANGNRTEKIGCGRIVVYYVAGFFLYVIYALIVNGLLPLAVGTVAPLVPAQTFSTAGISLTIPRSWQTTTDFGNEDFCKQLGVTCIVGGAPWAAEGGLDFEVDRFSSFLPLDLASIDAQTGSDIAQQLPGASLVVREQLKVNDHDAVERIYEIGQDTRMFVFVQYQSVIYRFYAQGSNSNFEQYRGSLNEMLESIRFESTDV